MPDIREFRPRYRQPYVKESERRVKSRSISPIFSLPTPFHQQPPTDALAVYSKNGLAAFRT